MEGRENLPKSPLPPLIFALNHLTPYDPILFVSLLFGWTRKKIFFLTQKEVALIFAPFNKLLGMIPASQKGLERAAKYLKEGHSIGIFVRAARSFLDVRHTRKYSGAARLSQKTGIPVVPVTVRGRSIYHYRLWVFFFQVIKSFFEKKDFFIHPILILKEETSAGRATNILLGIIEGSIQAVKEE